MAERYVGKVAVSVTVPAGGKPKWTAGSAVLTPSTTSGAASATSLQTAADAQLITHLSLHSADPGTTGANEIAGSRTAVTVTYSTGAARVVADTEGAVDAAGYTATYCAAWAVA